MAERADFTLRLIASRLARARRAFPSCCSKRSRPDFVWPPCLATVRAVRASTGRSRRWRDRIPPRHMPMPCNARWSRRHPMWSHAPTRWPVAMTGASLYSEDPVASTTRRWPRTRPPANRGDGDNGITQSSGAAEASGAESARATGPPKRATERKEPRKHKRSVHRPTFAFSGSFVPCGAGCAARRAPLSVRLRCSVSPCDPVSSVSPRHPMSILQLTKPNVRRSGAR